MDVGPSPTWGTVVRSSPDNARVKISPCDWHLSVKCECGAVVAHNLAKVRVAGSNPVIRSIIEAPRRPGQVEEVGSHKPTSLDTGAAVVMFLRGGTARLRILQVYAGPTGMKLIWSSRCPPSIR